MKPTIWIIDDEWDGYDIEMTAIRKAFPEAEIVISGMNYLSELDTVGAKADAIIAQISVKIDADMIAALKNCKIISVYGVGYDKIDVAAAKAKGIAVANVPGYCTDDVSDYVIAAIYHCNKTLLRYAETCRGGPWGAMAAKKLIRRIGGSTLFIIGLGRIGSEIARKANAMNMEVLCYDPYITAEQAEKFGVKKVELDDGLSAADFVSLNMKLTAETEGFMNMSCFKKMKSSAYLINASRGGTVNEADLIEAVKSGVIAGACLDVICHEPPAADDPIINTDGIFVTPHISYLTQSSLDELQLTAALNVTDFLSGKKVASVVNS
ncbi:MAG: C-terminal binding protein [Huintestinicola sp.]